MDPTRMLLLAANKNLNKWTEVTIPQVPYSGSPIDFGTLFFNTVGRQIAPTESATFILPAGNNHGIATNTTQGVNFCWRLGEGWGGKFPKQMRIVLNGSQFAAGGIGMTPVPNSGGFVSSLRQTDDFRADGGSIMSLANTESFINSDTPLLIEGAGGLYSGGGGSGCCWWYSTRILGSSGAGWPDRKYIYSPPDWQIGTQLTQGMFNQQNGFQNGEGGGQVTLLNTGFGGNYGRYGESAYYSGSGAGVGNQWGTNSPESGEPGLIFEWSGSSDARFQSQAGILACFDFSNYTGPINGQTAATWKASFAAMRANALFGYKNAAAGFNLYRKHLLGTSLSSYIPKGWN